MLDHPHIPLENDYPQKQPPLPPQILSAEGHTCYTQVKNSITNGGYREVSGQGQRRGGATRDASPRDAVMVAAGRRHHMGGRQGHRRNLPLTKL